MSETLKAQAKAAAWGLVAAVGIDKAISILRGIIAEIENSQWEGPGNR